MTVFRRSVLLVALAVATVLGLTISPAQAAYTAKAALPTATIGTVKVAAPTNVTAQAPDCNGRWVEVTVSWRPSTTAKVTGYRITAFRSDGASLVVADTDANTTSFSRTADRFDLAGYTTTFTVMTQTSYGWTAVSPKSGAITC